MGISIAARTQPLPTVENYPSIAQAMDQIGLRVRLPNGKLVRGEELQALPPSQLQALNVDVADLWSVLSDAATPENEGQILDLREPSAKTRYAVTDGLDGNYDRAVRPLPSGGVAFVAEASRLDDTREKTSAVTVALHAVADFFIEAFTFGQVDTYTFNGKDQPSDYESRGRELAERMPASLKALLDLPDGRARLIAQMMSQRPERVSEGSFRSVVEGVMQGFDSHLEESLRAGRFTEGLSSLLARDQMLTAWRQAKSDAERLAVVNLTESLKTSGFSGSTLESIAEGMASSGNGAQNWAHLASDLQQFSVMGRGDLVRAFARTKPEDVSAFFALLESETFRTRLNDVDRRLYLDAWVQPANASYRQGLFDVMTSDTWSTTSAETRQAIIRAFSSEASDNDRALTLRLLASPSFKAATPAERTMLIAALPAQDDHVSDFIAALPRIMELQPAARQTFLAAYATQPFDTQQSDLLNVRFEGGSEPLQHVLFDDRTLRQGENGQHVIVVQRYLQALGYSETLGLRNHSDFDTTMTATVKKFQEEEGMTSTGVVDRATLARMMSRLPGYDPPISAGFTHPRYTIEMSIDRPTATTDGPWTPTHKWDAAEEATYQVFAGAYMRARIDTREELDCADLAYETLIVFARRRGLPIKLSNGERTITQRSSGPIAGIVRSYFAAAHWIRNTTPIAIDDVRTSDIAIMKWRQSYDGHDSQYHHAYNVLGWSKTDRGQVVLIYGSLEDEVKQSALDTYARTHKIQLKVQDVEEDSIIDAITQNQGRGISLAMQRVRVRELLTLHSSDEPTAAQVDAFISLVADKRNILRDQPTIIYVSTGLSAFNSATSRDLDADPGYLHTAFATLNTRHRLALKENAPQQVEVTYRKYFPAEGDYRLVSEKVSVASDLAAVLAAPDDEQGLAIARQRALARGATEANADAIAADIIKEVNATRCFRRPAFATFNTAM